MPKTLIPVILCGGAGSRLWPLSRESHPKPFIKLADGQSLLQKTFLRGLSLGADEILTVTNRDLYFKTEDEYRELNCFIRPLSKLASEREVRGGTEQRTGVYTPDYEDSSNVSLKQFSSEVGFRNRSIKRSYLLEPFGRNTAPAIAASALHLLKTHGEDVTLLVLPADHLISDEEAFLKAVFKAEEIAESGKIVTFGITPDCPETGYGYIEAHGASVIRFIEKPSLEKAKEYLASENFFWNSGMFCFKASSLIQEMEIHCPEILFQTKTCLELSQSIVGEVISQTELEFTSFSHVPEDSIDYAVIEKSNKVAVVPCDMGWSDIGSWNALGDLTPSDPAGNRTIGETFIKETTNCYLRSETRLVCALGVDNLFIVDTPDALLVANKDRAQEVKTIYSHLKSQNHETHKTHRTVHRPWGSYTVLEEGPRFKIKRIEVRPHASLSLQMHYHRSEHWIVVSGMAQVINGDKKMFINTNESTYIPAGHQHRLENPGSIPLIMIEVQSGEYMGEDDIVRFEDAYGRR